MKLHDCACGGIAHVTYKINEKAEFVVSCPICGNTTPPFENLMEAVAAWNNYCWKPEDCVEEQPAE